MEMDEIKKKILEDVDPETHRKKVKAVRKERLKVTLEFLGLIGVILGLFYLMIGISTVQGNSMYPALHHGDRVLYDRMHSDYRVGDVVALDRPNGEELVKRITAVAGDTVNIHNGRLYVNGVEEEQDGLIGLTLEAKESPITYPLVVGEGEVFVLGDNREISSDSRMFGPVRIDDLKGRIICYIGTLSK